MSKEIYDAFTAQKAIFQKSIYKNLNYYYLLNSFKTVSNLLMQKYVPDKPEFEPFFRLWLILAPILDSWHGIFRTGWTKTNYISLIAFLSIHFHYITETSFIVLDPDLLLNSLQKLGITDKKILLLSKDLYITYYNRDNNLGKFAKTLFNKIFFATQQNDSYTYQRYNTTLHFSKKPTAKNIIRENIRIWDYQFGRKIMKNKGKDKQKLKTKLYISIANEITQEFKAKLDNATNEKQLIHICENFIEKHKYLYDAAKQFTVLNIHFQKLIHRKGIKTKYNFLSRYIQKSAQERNQPPQATTAYLPSVFSLDYSQINENSYLSVLFNPYKEL